MCLVRETPASLAHVAAEPDCRQFWGLGSTGLFVLGLRPGQVGFLPSQQESRGAVCVRPSPPGPSVAPQGEVMIFVSLLLSCEAQDPHGRTGEGRSPLGAPTHYVNHPHTHARTISERRGFQKFPGRDTSPALARAPTWCSF